jgi:thiamine-phosphate diphosphorylase
MTGLSDGDSIMLDPFYILVDSSDWLARLLPSGVRAAQLRIKDAAPEKLKAEIERASALCDRHGAQLVINDHWQEAMDAGCDYVHLGQEDLDHVDVHALRRAGVRYGVSTHDHQELDRALSLEPDYIAFGPIYDTTAKDLPFAPQGAGAPEALARTGRRLSARRHRRHHAGARCRMC